MDKDNSPQTIECGASDEGAMRTKSDDLKDSVSRCSSDTDKDLAACRVCHCVESDKRGDIVLGFLGITPPFRDEPVKCKDLHPTSKQVSDIEDGNSCSENDGRKSNFVEFVSPTGEIFICNTDLEMGFTRHDSLIELGCSCKSDLALVHYSCALKWFVNHGSTICEICGCVAKNIKTVDFKKTIAALKDYMVLRERTVNGAPNPTSAQTNIGVDPDAVAAIRRQRLSEISLWFTPYNHSNTVATTASVVGHEQPPDAVIEGIVATENPATKWAVEGTGILLATGLLTVTLAWLIAPRVGKRTARSGLHILLGGICALTVVVFFRFIVLTRIKYGPARYWAILFIFWFLVFGIWASRTHGAHTT